MRNATNQSSRRDAIKRIGGVLGGVSLFGHGTARGQAIGALPNGYTFYRVLRAGEGGAFGGAPNLLGKITGSVMLAAPSSTTGIGYVYVHGTETGTDLPALFEVAIDFGPVPPVVRRVTTIALYGNSIQASGERFVVGQIGAGACNTLGEYVTTIQPQESSDSISIQNSPGVFMYRPNGVGNGSWTRVLRFGDQVPDGSFYGGDFGDVAVDNNENLLIAAATTQTPGNISGFAGSQALIATSIIGAASASGRVVMQTGDMLPYGAGMIESIGLVDLAPNQIFAAQVSAKSVDPGVTRSGTALIMGNTQAAPMDQKLVAASPDLMSFNLASQRNVISGQTFFGARVDRLQDVAFVTHDDTFEPTTGSNDVETLGYYSRGTARQLERTLSSAAANQVIGLGAPCLGNTGLMYGTELMGDGSTRLFVSDGANSRVVLRSGGLNSNKIPTGDLVQGRAPNGNLMISEILFGQHSTQVDASGRIAFTAEFLQSTAPNQIENSSNVITALVIGIPR
jgi:hypothetical protein